MKRHAMFDQSNGFRIFNRKKRKKTKIRRVYKITRALSKLLEAKKI